MTASLVRTDMGLQVRRFASPQAARAAQAPIESDGIGVALMPVVCSWCGVGLGAKACAPHMAGLTSHGMCPACWEKLFAALDFPPLAIDEAASPSALPHPGPTASRGVTGTTAHGYEASALEHPSRGPAASSLSPAPLFSCVTGADFGRANAAAKARGNPLAVRIRAALAKLREGCRHA